MADPVRVAMGMEEPDRTIALRTGARMPRLGLGVFGMAQGGETRRAVLEAIAAGYRHFDTATLYRNEKDVGDAIRGSGVPRSDLFVTTKLWDDHHGYDKALRAFETSLRKLGLDYVDLYLIHGPVPRLRRETWRALERLHEERRARAIGVSNYAVHHLEEQLATARTLPMVNQIGVSPFRQQRDVRQWCDARGVVVQAYSPLTRGFRLNHAVIVDVAARTGMTPAQVLLRWGIQHGLVVLPKTIHAERMRENAAIFELRLDESEMERLDALEERPATGSDLHKQS